MKNKIYVDSENMICRRNANVKIYYTNFEKRNANYFNGDVRIETSVFMAAFSRLPGETILLPTTSNRLFFYEIFNNMK